MEAVMKPVLIIGCSAKKEEGTHRAFDLYKGNLYQQLKARINDPLAEFEILILSAKHGLVPARDRLSDYDQVMPSTSEGIYDFSACHKRSARALIKRVASTNVPVYVMLTNRYLAALDLMVGEEELNRWFQSAYVSRQHKGIGELRGRLSRVIEHETGKRPEPQSPVVFRSGVAAVSELGYVAAQCPVGSSLAHTNTEKMTHLLPELLATTAERPFFLDNGLITLLNQKSSFDTHWVFQQYQTIANTLRNKKARKNLFAVVPDDVSCPDRALDIVVQHRDEIRALSQSIEVILPIHRTDNIEQHAIAMMEALGFPRHIRLGIPCLSKPGLDLALSCADIERLLSIAHPSGKGRLFTKVHFLGLSDASAKPKLAPRLQLAALYQASVSMDSCRTTACFGSGRKGTLLADDMQQTYKKEQVTQSDAFTTYTYDHEFYVPSNEPRVTLRFYDMINEDEIREFIALYNSLLIDLPQLHMDQEVGEGEEAEAIEIAWQMVSIKAVDVALFEALKQEKWALFMDQCPSLSALPASQVRFDTIRALFGSQSANHQQVQLPLTLKA